MGTDRSRMQGAPQREHTACTGNFLAQRNSLQANWRTLGEGGAQRSADRELRGGRVVQGASAPPSLREGLGYGSASLVLVGRQGGRGPLSWQQRQHKNNTAI